MGLLKTNQVTINEYIKNTNKINLVKKTKLKNYHSKKKILKEEYSYLGYSSFRYLLYAIGFPLFSLVLSVLVLIILLIPNSVKKLKKLYLTAALGFTYVSFFWVLHSFLTRTDFPKYTYNLSFVILALLSTFIVFSVIFIIERRENKRKKIQLELKDLLNNGNELFNLMKKS